MSSSSELPDIEIRIGELIAEKYRVEAVIGEGGMGTVLRCVSDELERVVAIKVIRSDLAAHAGVATRMLLEARAAASITNEHVVRVLDLGRLRSGAPYIVMEYLEGQNLHRVLQDRGPLPVWQAVDWVLEVCEAIAEAHALGIVHRDIKPENLFLARRPDGSSMIKVLDFGVSKRTGDGSTHQGEMILTNPSTAVGSPHYMAPEQMRARGDVDGRADIYSLGAILFELLSGRPPFDSDNISTLCTLVLSEDPPTLISIKDQIPPELDAVIQRCLRKVPDQRFWSISELASAIAQFGSSAARGSVERVIRVLGDRPPPASIRPYTPAPSELRTLVAPAAPSLTSDRVVATEPNTPKPVSTSFGIRLGTFVALLLAGLLSVLIAMVGVSRSVRSAELRRALSRSNPRAVAPAPPSGPALVAPSAPDAAAETSAKPAREPVGPVAQPPSRTAAPHASAPVSDPFGGRK